MACGNCGSLSSLWAQKKPMTMATSHFQDEACPRVELQGTPCDEAKPLGAIEGGKQDRTLGRRISICSTSASSGSGSDSDTDGSDEPKSGDGTMDKSTVPEVRDARSSRRQYSGRFGCPHCCQKFETAEALYQHDTCMIMPSNMADESRSGNGTILSVGLKLDGKIQCPHCIQKFDTEKALSMHCKFIHDGAPFNAGYTLVYEFNGSKGIET
jgi:hypothetical protein